MDNNTTPLAKYVQAVVWLFAFGAIGFGTIQFLKYEYVGVDPNTEFSFRSIITILICLIFYKSASAYGISFKQINENFPTTYKYMLALAAMLIIPTVYNFVRHFDDWGWVPFASMGLLWAVIFLFFASLLTLTLQADVPIDDIFPKLFDAYLFGTVIYPITFLFMWLTGLFDTFAVYRAYPPYGGVSHYSYHVTLGIALAMVLFAQSSNRKKQLFYLATTFILWGYIIWAGRRGPVLLLLTVLPVLLIYIGAMRAAVINFSAFVVSGIIVYFMPTVQSNVTLWGRQLQIDDGVDINRFSSNRLEYWTSDLTHLFTERPILGYGAGQIRHSLGKWHTDNFVITMMLNTGPLFGLIITALYLYAIWVSAKTVRQLNNPIYTVAFVVFAFSFPYGLLDGVNYVSHGLLICVMMLAILTAYKDKPGSQI